MRYSVTTAPGVERRCRSGLCFTAQPKDVDGADMAEDLLHAILADPYLVCQPMPAAVDAPEAAPEAPAGTRRTSKKGGEATKEGTD